MVALECHILTTLDSVESIAEVVGAVGAVASPWVRVNFDPVNLLGHVDDVFASGDRILDMQRVLGGYYTPTAHAKDVVIRDELVVHIDEAVPGEGVLDWSAFFSVVSAMDNGAVIVEHLTAEVAPRGLENVRNLARRAGTEFLDP